MGTIIWGAPPLGTVAAISGAAIVDFGSTPNDEAQVVVTGLTDLTASSRVSAFILDDSTTSDNTAAAHASLAFASKVSVGVRVAGVGFTISVRLLIGKATGTYDVDYLYTP
jgi:hypothetical protein